MLRSRASVQTDRDAYWLQHAVEVAVYNLLSYLWEIETGTIYKMTTVCPMSTAFA